MFFIYLFKTFLFSKPDSIKLNQTKGQTGNKRLSLNDNSENLFDDLISSDKSLPPGVAPVSRPTKTDTTVTDTAVNKVYGNQQSGSSEANEIANDNSGRRDWANQDLLSSTTTNGNGVGTISPTGTMRRCIEADSESNNKKNKTSNTLACRLIESAATLATGLIADRDKPTTPTRFNIYDERRKEHERSNPLGTSTAVIDEDKHRHQQQSSMTNNRKVGNQFVSKHATTSSMTTCRPLVYRSIEWPPTSAGMTAVRPCPKDTVGMLLDYVMNINK